MHGCGELTRWWVERAREIPGFRLHTPVDAEDLGAVSLFSIDGVDTRSIELELRNAPPCEREVPQRG